MVMTLYQFMHALADLIEDWRISGDDKGYMTQIAQLHERYTESGGNKDEFKVGI
jgi:hypothetical protein